MSDLRDTVFNSFSLTSNWGNTMVIDERSRHRLYQKLEERLGAEEANTLMAHLPPVGWADVATKHDLETLHAIIRLEHESLENRLQAAWRSDLAAQSRHLTMVMIGMNSGIVVAVALLAFGAAKLV